MSGARLARRVLAATALATVACGSAGPPPTSSPPHRTPPPSPSLAPSATSPGGPLSVATLRSLYGQIDPGGSHRCVGGGTTPSWSACPLTPRLVTALDASLAARTGPGADPLCGCQAFDPQQQVTYTVSGPDTGTIAVTSFGAPLVRYAVVASAGAFLIDDIVYCTPAPHSIYPSEAVAAC